MFKRTVNQKRNGPVLISGMMDLSRPLPLLLAMVPPLINWSLAHQQLRFPFLAVPFRRVMLTGVASETVETVRAPLVTKPTRLRTGNKCRPIPMRVGCWWPDISRLLAISIALLSTYPQLFRLQVFGVVSAHQQEKKRGLHPFCWHLSDVRCYCQRRKPFLQRPLFPVSPRLSEVSC